MATPNMGLVLPAVGVTIGPTWASELNTALEAVDAHDHTGGNGLPITTQAIAIDADLSFDGYGLEDVARVELVSQAAVSALPSTVYVVAGDLYYNNASGVPVQITTGGSIAGATGAISGLVAPASASFDSGTASFRWNANATTRATLDAAALQLRQAGGVSAASITLAAPATGVTSYTLRLPAAAPATVSRFLFTGTSGDSVWIQPDASTVEVSGTTLRAKDLGITTAKLANLAVTTAKIADLNVTTGKIADLGVTTGKLADLSVATGKLADLGVTTGKLADLSVTTAKLGDLSVATGKLVDLAVTTAKLDDLSVTTAKIGAAQVTLAKMANDSVDTAQIKYGAVTGGIGVGVTPTGSLAYRTIVTENLSELSITTAKIGDGQVTPAKRDVRFGYGLFQTTSTTVGTTTFVYPALAPGATANLDNGRVVTVSIQPLSNGSVGRFEFTNLLAGNDWVNVSVKLKNSVGTTLRNWTYRQNVSDMTCTIPSLVFQDTVTTSATGCYVELSAIDFGTANITTVLENMVWTISQ